MSNMDFSFLMKPVRAKTPDFLGYLNQARSLGDLADQLLLTHHAAVQLVNRMAKAGVAARAPSSTDRRSVLVKLTGSGEALLDRLAGLHMEEVLRQEPQLTRSMRRLRRLSAGPDGSDA